MHLVLVGDPLLCDGHPGGSSGAHLLAFAQSLPFQYLVGRKKNEKKNLGSKKVETIEKKLGCNEDFERAFFIARC